MTTNQTWRNGARTNAQGFVACEKRLASNEHPITGTAQTVNGSRGEVLVLIRNEDGSKARRSLGFFPSPDEQVQAIRAINFPE